MNEFYREENKRTIEDIYFKDMQNTTMERKTKDQRFRKIFRRIEETDCEFSESKISKF